MKRLFYLIFGALILFFSWSAVGFSSERVEIEVAKRTAEYHGELIFENDLKVCDHELMYWPWGEPAVYVFTLTNEGGFYPQNISLDNTFLLGSFLVSDGKEFEGYTVMAQADRYMTVVVGATTDMPPFIKAHAGLPEHVLALGVMDNPPLEPYWIYGGLFHTFVGSKMEMNLGESRATEIHLGQTVALKELGIEKIGTIPAYAEEFEWGLFMNPQASIKSEENPYLMNVAGVKPGKHKLVVTEENVNGNWVGCSPAAFYNCLKYLEKRGLVSTGNKGINYLLKWIAICYRTDPADGGTQWEWIPKGSSLMFRGLGYKSTCSQVGRNDKPGLFLTQFANEINNDYPCNLGSTGTGVFTGHSTTGIGYWKQGSHYRLIIHDGWKKTPDNPIYVKYSGYPDAGLEYPRFMRTFHPGGKKGFPEAEPEIEAPESVTLDTEKKQWIWEEKITSKNKVKAEGYAMDWTFYDTKGKKYERYSPKRAVPYFSKWNYYPKKTSFEAGKSVIKYLLVDDNGHLLQATSTVELIEGGIVGTWKGYLLANGVKVPSYWYINEDGTFRDNYPKGHGRWKLNNDNSVKFTYTDKGNKQYGLKLSGTINSKFDKINGTWAFNDGNSGKWKAWKVSDEPSLRLLHSRGKKNSISSYLK